MVKLRSVDNWTLLPYFLHLYIVNISYFAIFYNATFWWFSTCFCDINIYDIRYISFWYPNKLVWSPSVLFSVITTSSFKSYDNRHNRRVHGALNVIVTRCDFWIFIIVTGNVQNPSMFTIKHVLLTLLIDLGWKFSFI